MAGESGGRWYVVSEAVQPCCLDNVIIEFRLIEGRADNERFGFDWLRSPQEKDLVHIEAPYVSADYDPSVKGTVLRGFREWTEEELQVLRAAEKLKVRSLYEQDPYRRRRILDELEIARMKIAEHTDLSAYEAHEQMKKDYENFQLVCETKVRPYRWLTYYVPWMTLFPPIEKLMSESCIETSAKVLAMKNEQDLSDNEKLIMQKAVEIEARRAYAREQGKQVKIPPKVSEAEALEEMAKYSGICSKATLRLLKDIKMEPPEKITIEYDDRYLRISLNNSPDMLEKKLDYATTHLVELKLPKDCYAVNPKIQEIEGMEVMIEAIDEFAADQEVTVYSYPVGGEPRRKAGKLIVCANDKSKRKNIEIALVPIKTYIENRIDGETGVIKDKEVMRLRHVLYQALMTADIKIESKNRSGKVQEHLLHMNNDPRFFMPPAPSSERVAPDGRIYYSYFLDRQSGAVEIYASNIGVHLEKKFLKEFPGMRNRFLVFAFAVPSVRAVGVADSIKWFDEGDGINTNIRQSCFLFSNRDDGGEDIATLAHEFLHTLNLLHTHRETQAVLRLGTYRYVFPRGDELARYPEATNNVMAYNHKTMCWQTWRWQWLIMRADTNTTVIERKSDDRSGVTVFEKIEEWPTIDDHNAF